MTEVKMKPFRCLPNNRRGRVTAGGIPYSRKNEISGNPFSCFSDLETGKQQMHFLSRLERAASWCQGLLAAGMASFRG